MNTPFAIAPRLLRVRSRLGALSVALLFCLAAACDDGGPSPVAGVTEEVSAPITVSLINANNGQAISGYDPIADGATITLSALQTQSLSIRANASGVGSIRFQLDSSYMHAENIAPYSLCGDQTTIYTPCPRLNVVGSHSLTVTPYSEPNLGGTAGAPTTVSFNIETSAATAPSITTQPLNQTVATGQSPTFTVTAIGSAPLGYQWYRDGSRIAGATSASYTKPAATAADDGAGFSVVASNSVGSATSDAATLTVTSSSAQSVIGFTLINAPNGQPIPGYDPIANGAIITLASLPTQQLSIRANTSPSTVGSVNFVLDGSYTHAENMVPYSLCGDVSTSYTPCPQLNAAGNHTLTATPYSGSGLSGTPGTARTINFTIQTSGGATVPGAPTITSATPDNTQATVSWAAPADGGSPITSYTVTSNPGAIVRTVSTTTATVTGLTNGTSYTFTVFATNGVGNGPASQPSAPVTPTASPLPQFPLAVAPNHRYLQDSNGVPFAILGDAGWSSSHNLSVAEQTSYVNDRVARGFNAVLTEVIEHKFTIRKPPMDAAGNLPFTRRLDAATYTGSPNGTTSASGTANQFPADPYTNVAAQAPDFTYPNGTYWSRMDSFITLCGQNGIVVFLFPGYVGYGGGDEGWMAEMVANDAVIGAGGFAGQPWANNSKSRLWNYGAWLANRYRAAGNIVWVHGGDYGNSGGPGGGFTAAQKNAVNNLFAGVKSVTGQQSVLHTGHWARRSMATDVSFTAGTFDLEAVYADTATAQWSRSGYAHSPVAPTFEFEDYYEGSTTGGEPNRRFQWWAFLSSPAGYFFGNASLWRFGSGWSSSLNTQGARDMGRLNSFISGNAWYNLVPSGLAGMRTLVTAGGGTANPQSSDYVASAATSDGGLLVAYVPPAHSGSITIDMTAMAAPARARWFNPTNGAYTDIGTGLANVGTRVFTPPGNNGSGYTDWVLVVDVP